MDNKELFSSFPYIDSEFDMVCFDCVKMTIDEESKYIPLVRYMIRNVKKKTVEAGFTIRTGFIADDLNHMAEFINRIVGARFFTVSVSSLGTIYDEDMNEIEDVDWNDHLLMEGEVPDEKYLH